MTYKIHPYIFAGIDTEAVTEKCIIEERVIKLKNKVCNKFDTDLNELKGKCRKTHLVVARYIVFIFFICETKKTLDKIGQIFNRDHSTVIYSKKIIKNIIDTKDRDYYEATKDVLESVNAFDRVKRYLT